MKPNRPKNAAAIENLAALKRTSRNRVMSSIGSLVRCSQAAKTASNATPAPYPARVTGASQHGDRDRSEEDRAPGEVLKQEAACDRAERHAKAGDPGPHADRRLSFPGVGEGIGEDGQSGREDQGRGQAHQA